MNKLCLLIILVFCFVGCKSEDSSKSSSLKVIVTTGMVAEAVRKVGRDYVNVEVLMESGVDPHTYKPSPGDIKKIQQADLVVYNGLHLEGKMGDILTKVAEKKPVLSLGDSVDKKRILTSQGQPDPHLWMDPSLWLEVLPAVSKQLSSLDSSHAEEFRKNAIRYAQDLQVLHKENKKFLSQVPLSQRVLVTAHDAFRYFGRAYQVEVRGVQGISTESEAGLNEINQLVELIIKKKVRAVFVESSVSQRSVMALLEGARSRGHQVKLGGQLYSDSMGDSETVEGTYEGMIRHNVRAIIRGLK